MNCVLTFLVYRVVVPLLTGAAPRMFLSAATLVIVPVTLIPHWQQQVGPSQPLVTALRYSKTQVARLLHCIACLAAPNYLCAALSQWC